MNGMFGVWAPRLVAALAGTFLIEKIPGPGRKGRLLAGLDSSFALPSPAPARTRTDDPDESGTYDSGNRRDPFSDLSAPFTEAFALGGDVSSIAGRHRDAAELYALAERTSPGQATLCGRLYDGKLYAAESFLHIEWFDASNLTGYLLAWDLRTDRVGRDFDDRLPLDLPELEQALRAAARRDPTQWWHPFYLGQALFAQRRRQEAETLWRGIWDGRGRPIPHYDLLQMAMLHESFGQRKWADHGFARALEERHRLPWPLAFGQERERRICSKAYELDFALRDPGRRYLWWHRLREIGGVAPGDAFRAVLWAAALDRRGDPSAARDERAFAERARRTPFDTASRSAWLDYSFYGVVATAATLFAHLAVLAAHGLLSLRRRRGGRRGLAHAFRGAGGRWALFLVPFAFYLALTLAAHSASYMAFVNGMLPAALSDSPAPQKVPPLPEYRFPATAAGLLFDWLTTDGVQPLEDQLEPSFVLKEAQKWHRLTGHEKALRLAAGFDGMFVLALPAALLLAWGRARTLAARWIPGAAQVRARSPLRGYALFGLFIFVVVPLGWLTIARVWGAVPAPGIVSANFFLRANLDQPLLPIDPSEAGVPFDSRQNFEQLRARSFLPLLFVYPGAELFGSLVAAALATSLGFLVRTRRADPFFYQNRSTE